MRFAPATVMDGHVTDLEVVVVDGAGHWVQQQRPDEVNAALLSSSRAPARNRRLNPRRGAKPGLPGVDRVCHASPHRSLLIARAGARAPAAPPRPPPTGRRPGRSSHARPTCSSTSPSAPTAGPPPPGSAAAACASPSARPAAAGAQRRASRRPLRRHSRRRRRSPEGRGRGRLVPGLVARRLAPRPRAADDPRPRARHERDWGTERKLGSTAHFVEAGVDLAANPRASRSPSGAACGPPAATIDAVQSAFRRPSTAFGGAQTRRRARDDRAAQRAGRRARR